MQDDLNNNGGPATPPNPAPEVPGPGPNEFLQKARAQNLRLSLENNLLRRGVRPGAMLDDSIDALLSRSSLEDNGELKISGLPSDIALDSFVSTRPHLTIAAPADPVRTATRAGWDPSRVTEPEYGRAWKEADPAGYRAAFDRHLNAIMKQNRAK